MALPKLTVMKHKLSLPSTGEKITYRPFLVKEEKILMMAMQSEDPVEMVVALREIIKNCVESDINVERLPVFDVEYIFLQLRSKSVGETIDLSYTVPDEICEVDKKECLFALQIILDDITVEKTKEHNPLIDITDSIKIKMKYPEIEMSTSVSAGLTGDSSNMVDVTFKMIEGCIEYIMDGEEIHKPDDYTEKEIDDFINSLSSAQFKSIQGFFETMPKLRKRVTGKCSKCEKENEKVLEGLADFFV